MKKISIFPIKAKASRPSIHLMSPLQLSPQQPRTWAPMWAVVSDTGIHSLFSRLLRCMVSTRVLGFFLGSVGGWMAPAEGRIFLTPFCGFFDPYFLGSPRSPSEGGGTPDSPWVGPGRNPRALKKKPGTSSALRCRVLGSGYPHLPF